MTPAVGKLTQTFLEGVEAAATQDGVEIEDAMSAAIEAINLPMSKLFQAHAQAKQEFLAAKSAEFDAAWSAKRAELLPTTLTAAIDAATAEAP